MAISSGGPGGPGGQMAPPPPPSGGGANASPGSGSPAPAQINPLVEQGAQFMIQATQALLEFIKLVPQASGVFQEEVKPGLQKMQMLAMAGAQPSEPAAPPMVSGQGA